MITNVIQFHNDIFFFLHRLVGISDVADNVIYFIAETLDLYVVFVGVIFIIIHTHKPISNTPHIVSSRSITEGVYVVAGVVSAWGISYALKLIFASPRPFLSFTDFIPLFPYGGYDSFPSGHATLFAALAVSIYLYHKKVGSVFILFAFLIGISRTIGGVHFPIDIIAGWMLGGLVSYWVIYFISRKKTQI